MSVKAAALGEATALRDALREVVKLLGLPEASADVLSYILTTESPVTMKEIAEATGLSKASVYRILRILDDMGLVEKRAARGGKPGRPTYVYTVSFDVIEKLRYLAEKRIEKVEKVIRELTEAVKTENQRASPDNPVDV